MDTSVNEIPRTAVDIVATPPPPSPVNKAGPGRSQFFRGGEGGNRNKKVGGGAASEPVANTELPVKQAAKSNKFTGFLRRPRPLGGPSGAGITTAAEAFTVTTEETGATEITDAPSSRFVEFVPTASATTTTTAAPPPPTTTSRFQLEDFFGTPESVAASELSAFSPSSARLVEARPASEDISENLILDEVRSRTAAITGKREREREKRRQYCF